MQILIKKFYDSEKRQSTEISNYLLVIEDNSLSIKSSSKSYNQKNFIELFRKPFSGWHNIRFNFDKGDYKMDSGNYISMQSDILIQDECKYQIKHYSISFIPMRLHNLDNFFDYLSNINGLSEEQSKIAKQIKEERTRKKELLKQKTQQLKIEKQKAEQLERQNFISMINQLKEDRELEKIFLNYFSKYVKNAFLNIEYHISLFYDLLKYNNLYKEVEAIIQTFRCTVEDDYLYGKNYKLDQLNKLLEFMKNKFPHLHMEQIKIFTWVELCDVATTHYSNCFYELYGKQIDDLDNLSLNECISRYIHSDMVNDNTSIRGMFIYYLMSLGKFDKEDIKGVYIYCSKVFNDIYEELKNQSEYDSFINSLLVKKESDEVSYSIDDIDLMSGNEFEMFVGKLFKKMGYKTTVTKASGDQGIDVIAEKNGVRYGIQAKCYSSAVSNSAIQEVVAGISFYKCDKALVITNNYFTNSAIELARANQVVLWDREMLKQKIRDVFFNS